MRKMMIVTLVMLGILLTGCGSKTVSDTYFDEDGFDSKKTEEPEIDTPTFSEYLGSGRKIAYGVKELPLDKEKEPEEIYFFDNGRVTPYPLIDDDVGLTMGELSRMTDEELWTGTGDGFCLGAENIDFDFSSAMDLARENILRLGIMYKQNDNREIGDYAKHVLLGTCMSLDGNLQDDFEMLEVPIEDEDLEYQAEMNYGGVDEVKRIGEEVYANMQESLPEIEAMLHDLPMVFALETDSSGNVVQDEAFVYPYLMHAPRIIRLGGKCGMGQVYDSNYSLYECSDSRSEIQFLCIRDEGEMVFDEIGKENVLVDIPLKNSLKELFEYSTEEKRYVLKGM